MSIIKNINENMPALLNRETKEYEAIFGKEEFYPVLPAEHSSDYKCGAIANELEFLKSYAEMMYGSIKIENAVSEELELLAKFFLNMERQTSESDAELLNRVLSMLRRKNFANWIVKWAIKKVFSYYFDESDIFVIENYIESSTISNGDFEDGSGDVFTDWTKTEAGTSVVVESTADKFEGQRCAEFQVDSNNSAISLEQTVTGVVAGDYKAAFFYEDDDLCPSMYMITLEVTRSSDSYYYNFFDNSWQVAQTGKDFLKIGSNYQYAYGYVKNTGTEDLTFKIANKGATGTAYKFRIDLFKFGEWKTYPSVKVLLTLGFTAGGFMSLWKSGSDPKEESSLYSLINEMKIDINAHMLDLTSHTNDDDVTPQITSVDATSISTAQTLVNEERSVYEAHRVRLLDAASNPVHGAEDNTNIVTEPAASNENWGEIVRLANDIRTQYEAHRQLVGSVHLAADTTNVVSASAVNVYDYDYASFLDNDYIAGVGGSYVESFYDNLLEKIKTAGAKSLVEMIA